MTMGIMIEYSQRKKVELQEIKKHEKTLYLCKIRVPLLSTSVHVSLLSQSEELAIN